MDLISILRTFGYLGLFLIIFAESGLLIGLFLPGDSLLFAAGVLASQGYFNVGFVLVLTFLAAVVGDSVGYVFGNRVGRRLFNRTDSVLFKKEYLVNAENFYEKYGKFTIIIARFVPVVRTFAPIVAGMGKMNYSIFVFYNLIGGLLWAVGVTLAGYFLGNLIPDIDKYLLPIILLVVVLSVVPSLYHLLKTKESRLEIWNMLKKALRIK